MKRCITVIMLIASGTMFFAACKKEQDVQALPVVRYLMPGDAPQRYSEVIADVNRKLYDDRGINISVSYFPWEIWQQRVNLMLTTGEAFDLFHIMQDQIQMSSYQAMGGLISINQLVDQYGPHLRNAITEGAWDAMRIAGQIYGIPAQWAEFSNEDGFTMRKDVLDKFGQGVPASIDELINTARNIASRWDGSGRLYVPVWGFTDFAKIPFARTYDTWPFIVKDAVALIRQDGTVDSWIESEEFRMNAVYMRRLNQAGLIHPDVLTLNADTGNAIYRSGNWFFTIGGIDSYIDDVRLNNNPDIMPEDYILVKMNSEKPDIYPVIVKNLNGVSSTSRNPERAIMFFDWLYSNQENYDLFMYGRDGQEFTVDSRGFKTELLGTNNRSLYSQADWMLGNMNFMRLNSNVLPMEIRYLYTPNPNAVVSPASNFFFDSSQVQAEWANIQSEFRTSIVPIYAGVLDYDSAFPQAVQRMRAAGLERALAEYQRQLTSHIESGR